MLFCLTVELLCLNSQMMFMYRLSGVKIGLHTIFVMYYLLITGSLLKSNINKLSENQFSSLER